MSGKKDKNPMGEWWKTMGEKDHGSRKAYNRSSERRANKVDWEDEVEFESQLAEEAVEC